MSRKHYRQTAAILQRATQSTSAPTELVREIAADLAVMFKRDNPCFSRQRFMDAIFEENPT